MFRRSASVRSRESHVRFTAASSSTSVSSSARIRDNGHALGPSDRAFSGCGCVSMKSPATPAATAARASTGTNSRWPPDDRALSARELHGVRRIEDDRASGVAHDRERPHVGHQVVIAERRAALAHEDVVGAARGLGLGDHLLHVLGRQELALLDVDRPARRGDRLDEIGLPAQERGRLQHVDRGRRPTANLPRSCARRSAPARRRACARRRGCAGLPPCPDRGTTRASCGWPCRRRT